MMVIPALSKIFRIFLIFVLYYGKISMLHKLNNLNQWYLILFLGIIIPFLAIITFRNLVKMQIPRSSYGRDTLILFQFVQRQSEFAFFGALTSVGALFLFYGGRKCIVGNVGEKFLIKLLFAPIVAVQHLLYQKTKKLPFGNQYVDFTKITKESFYL